MEENPELISVTLGFHTFMGKRWGAHDWLGLVYTLRECWAGFRALSPGPSPGDMGGFAWGAAMRLALPGSRGWSGECSMVSAGPSVLHAGGPVGRHSLPRALLMVTVGARTPWVIISQCHPAGSTCAKKSLGAIGTTLCKEATFLEW